MKTVSKSEHKSRSAYRLLNRFHWLQNEGCDLSFDLDKLTKKLLKDAPDWKPEYAKRAAESHDPRSGWVRTDTDWSNLNNVPLAKIIKNAQKKQSRIFREFTDYNPFAGLCDDRPSKAISALSLELKKGRFHSTFWETYLSRETRKKDRYRLKLITAGRIAQIPNENFKDILLTASRWSPDHEKKKIEKNLRMFEAIWDKFIQTIREYEN